MSKGHYIEKCVHGVVLSQCRCPGQRTEYVVECPPSCAPKSVVEIERLQAAIAERDAEIERLRADVSKWKAVANHESATLDAISREPRPTPTLAEVAMHVLAQIWVQPQVVRVEHAAKEAVDVAEALLAELERRGK